MTLYKSMTSSSGHYEYYSYYYCFNLLCLLCIVGMWISDVLYMVSSN